MIKFCKTCNVLLELVHNHEPHSEDHYQCPVCDGTYNIFDLEKCDCKYGHAAGKCKWPTLEGRLNQPLTSEKEALLQLYKIGGCELSEAALKRVEKYLEEDKQLQETRKKIQFAVDNSPKLVSFEEAKKQVNEKYKK
jgi:hypothetical protein